MKFGLFLLILLHNFLCCMENNLLKLSQLDQPLIAGSITNSMHTSFPKSLLEIYAEMGEKLGVVSQYSNHMAQIDGKLKIADELYDAVIAHDLQKGLNVQPLLADKQSQREKIKRSCYFCSCFKDSRANKYVAKVSDIAQNRLIISGKLNL